MKVTLIIQATVPAEVSEKDFACYVHDAVCATRGGLDPKDPLFYLDPSEVQTFRAVPIED